MLKRLLFGCFISFLQIHALHAFTYTYSRQNYTLLIKNEFDIEDVKSWYLGVNIPFSLKIYKNQRLQVAEMKVAGGIPLQHPQKEHLWLVTALEEKVILQFGVVEQGKFINLLNRSFQVINIPPPTMYWQVNSRRISKEDHLIKVPASSRIELIIQPDSDFKSRFPIQARYVAKGVKVYVQSGLRSSKSPANYDSQQTNIVTFKLFSHHKSGTKIVIEKGSLFRLNRNGKSIPIPHSEDIWPPPLVLILR